jgi:hypothetical protein
VHNGPIEPVNIQAMKHRFIFLLGLCLPAIPSANANSTLEFLVTETNSTPGKIQSVTIKDGKILVKDVGGGGNLDFIYSANPEILFMVDHGKRTVTTLDKVQINRIAKQTEAVQPLLQGFGEQLSKLEPKQRAKWEAMLGGKIPLDSIAEAAKPALATKIVKSGQTRKVAEIACQPMSVFQGKKKSLELCMAEPAQLNLSSSDYATLRSLLGFLEDVSSKTEGVSKQFGINLPNFDLSGISGVPIELYDVSSHSSLSLRRIADSAVAEEAMKIPDGYQYGPFKLW